MKSTLKNNDGPVFSWPKATWLYITIIPSVVYFASSINTILSFWLSISMVLTVGLGHTVGLHRGVIHKSYKMNKWTRRVLVYLFVHTGLGSPLSWLKLHYVRDYWQNQTTGPAYFLYHHSLLKDYYWNLHFSYSSQDLNPFQIPEYDLNDSWIKWLDKTWYWHIIILSAIIWWFFGFSAFIVLICFRIAITQIGHWFVGYISHVYGYRNFEINNANETGFNNWLLGILSFGEGFHNNHHACPKSARLGMRWFEFDLGWILMLGLKKAHLIYDVEDIPKKVKKTNAVLHSNLKILNYD